MGAALSIRDDIPAAELRRLARLEADGRVACRLLALANALDGMSRAAAAEQAGMDRQTLRDWVVRFNEAGIAGLSDRPRSGRPAFLGEGQLATLRAPRRAAARRPFRDGSIGCCRSMALRGPDPGRDGVSSWTAKDLCRIVEARFGVAYSANGRLRLLHDLGLSWQKARPVHPQADAAAQGAFKKASRR